MAMRTKERHIEERARRLNDESICVHIHDHMMFEYAVREALGEEDIFDTHYAPQLRKGGIDVIATTVGGNSPCVCNLTDDLVTGSLEQIDMLRRAEKQSTQFQICCSAAEIEKAVGENGGVIGLEMVKTEIKWKAEETGEYVTFDEVIRHMDHIAELIGTEHIGLGFDFDNYVYVYNIHRAMCPGPGSIEGFYTGVPKGNHMLDEPNNSGEAWVIADYLVKHGYSDADIKKILGGNMMRLCKETLV